MITTTTFHQSVHLGRDKLENPESECPFCGSEHRESKYLLQDTPEVLLQLCANCHAASASRMPTGKALDEYYNGYYDTECFSDSENKVTFSAVSRFGKHLASKFAQYQNDLDVSILDFGGGDGSISHAVAMELLKMGANKIDITVIDYNEDTISPQDERISITRQDNLEDISKQFSIVIASAVIEHIPKPRDILNNLLRCVKKGGVFYARTPIMLPLMRMLSYVGIKLDFTYPAHIHDLGQHFWEAYFNHVVKTDNFEILASNPSMVETAFKDHFLKTMAAYLFKAPWYVIGRPYQLVGGWEVFVRKN